MKMREMQLKIRNYHSFARMFIKIKLKYLIKLTSRFLNLQRISNSELSLIAEY